MPYKLQPLLGAHNKSSEPTPNHTIRVNAPAIADAQSGVIEHASIVLRATIAGYQILASGQHAQVDSQLQQMAQADTTLDSIPELTLHDRVIIPALVNAHTHLDLSHIGPIAHDPGEGFVKWVDIIRANRKDDDHAIREAVALGIEFSLAGGSIAVGDIAGAPAGRITDAPAHELADSPIFGVSYLEFFGIGKTAPGAIKKIEHYLRETYPESAKAIAGKGVQIGLQPHAPNTVDRSVYRWACAAAHSRSMPLSTHLAETPEERQFIAAGTGPQRELLERLGVWDDSILDHIGHGHHPVEHLREILDAGKEHAPMLVAHVNDATDEAIAILALTNTAVAYCSRASEYFGAATHFGPHRYQDMLAAGIRVCLGTDSIVNLDTPDRISILDEIRLLARRDGTDSKSLLAMGTTNGAIALGLDEDRFTLAAGTLPFGLLALPIKPGQTNAWNGAMHSNEPPEWVCIGSPA